MLDFGQRETAPMAEETTAQFLLRRRAELSAQISALRGQLGPKEAELEQIDKMLALTGNYTSALEPFLDNAGANALLPGSGSALSQLHAARDALNPIDAVARGIANALRPIDDVAKGVANAIDPTDRYSRMTIKQLVVQALLDHFPEGASLKLIREFIRDGYGRVIEQSSLRPQIHRLKADGVLFHRPENDTWNLLPRKRSLYAMYDHPTSRAAMKELQDEPELSARRTIAGSGGDDFLE
jgi:hypothetical protein